MTTKTDKAPQQSRSMTRWPIRWKTVFWLVGLVFLLWAGIKAWRIGQAVNSLLAQQTAVQTVMANGITGINPDEAAAIAQTVRHDFVVLRDETAFLMPVLPKLGWMPKVGPLLEAAPQLVEMGDAGTETAVYAIESLKPLLQILQAEQSGESQLSQLINALADARPGLAAANQSLTRVVQARANIQNTAEFPQQAQTLFALADEWLPIAQDSLTIVQILPEIMGVNGRRTYILLAQNEDELRATGGFISGIGILTMENGDIQDLSFQDASLFDIPALRENSTLYEFPPQPLYELMGAEYLLLRDANYWPDFPYSAQTAVRLFNMAQPETAVAGVIAIDQQFMSLLVAATGPVTIPGTGEKINANNTVDSFRNAFNIEEGQTVQDWLRNRKAFLATFSSAILNKVQSNFGSIDPVAFIKNMHSALKSRHLQLYLVDVQETAVLEQLNWDGRLQNPTNQDFLLVLDTNMGFNKANMHVDRAYTYHVDLVPNGQSTAVLTINYTYTQPPADDAPCEQSISYENAPTYQEIADRCYFNYLRVYAPPNATLTNATRHTIPAGTLISGLPWEKPAETTTEFASFTTFANFMMLPRGETLNTEFAYNLPQTILQQENSSFSYNLWLQKQASTEAETVTVIITLPPNSTILNVTATGEAIINNQSSSAEITLNLDTDTLLTVTFEQ